MLDGEYARVISENANFGLANQIFRQIEASGQSAMLEDLSLLSSRMNMYNPSETMGSASPVSLEAIKAKVNQWNSSISEASKINNIDPQLITAMIVQESGGNPYAVSRAGAKGLMQLMDSTAQELSVRNVFDPHENILGGTRYLSQMLKECNGDESLALASYNAGLSAVKKYGDIPPYRETQDYVSRVLQVRKSLIQQSQQPETEQTEE
jgi:soluble lytic murein transglycosylase-like protein